MPSRIIIKIIVSAAILFFVAWYVFFRAYSFNGNKIEKISIKGHDFNVEIVSSPDKLQKGLGEREKMCKLCGMLFVFQKEGNHSFWMKGMRFPLDIIWLKDGKVVYIEKNVSEKSQDILSADSAADSVLELNAGISDEIGINEGDKIEI